MRWTRLRSKERSAADLRPRELACQASVVQSSRLVSDATSRSSERMAPRRPDPRAQPLCRDDMISVGHLRSRSVFNQRRAGKERAPALSRRRRARRCAILLRIIG